MYLFGVRGVVVTQLQEQVTLPTNRVDGLPL